MENLNAEQIIKALGNCIKNGCKIYYPRGDNLIADALSLIKELTEEVEQRIEDYSESQKKWETAYDKLEEENESLKEDKLELEAILDLRSKRKFYNKFVKEVFQKQEGKKLTHPDFDYIYEQYFKLTEENERLRKALDTDISIVRLSRGNGKTHHLREVARVKMDAVRADTVSTIQNKFAVHFGTYTDKDTVKVVDVFRLLDQIAKEMLEGKK
jgi:hypothetical protein